MLDLKTPQIQDKDWVQYVVAKTDNRGSDLSFGNLYLLRNKYDTKICRMGDLLIRKYNGVCGRLGFTFPIGEGDTEAALHAIEKKAAALGESLRFCLMTEEQKKSLEQFYPGRFKYNSDEGDSDYIYRTGELAVLPGKTYHKKKNHVSRFFRTYEEIELRPIDESNKEDAWVVQERWYHNHAEQSNYSQMAERNAIKEALEHFEELSLKGGVLYVDGIPAAMTIASEINRDTCDIHFEKVVDEYAVSGGYSVINKLFAEKLTEYEWVNREEDIGIEGLRKAKLSYHPQILLKKYSAVSI
jgi:hypothetical protein